MGSSVAEALGLSWLPAAVPTRGTVGDQTGVMQTRSPGDPALVQLGSYVATVMQAQLNDAWMVIDTSSPIVRPGAIDGTRDGVGVVRRVYYHDPRKGAFIAENLPGLFVYQPKQNLKTNRPAQDAHRLTRQVGIMWIPGPPPSEEKESTERASFRQAVRASLHNAFTWKRHPAWTVAADDAIPEGLKTSFGTSTSPLTITNFNGSQLAIAPQRSAMVSTTVAPGAYNTSEPIVWTGLDERRDTVIQRVYLTNPNGGETIPTVLRFKSIVRVDIPAMLLITGAIKLGWWDSYEKAQGSLVMRACAFSYMQITDIRDVDFEIKRSGDQASIPVSGVEALVSVGEDTFWDPDFRAQRPYDIEAHVQHVDGTDFTSVEIEGS